MNQVFQGWEAVAELLRERAASQEQVASDNGEDATRLNLGQRASLRAIASRIPKNGVVIADEVGMGKTRIAVELARCVLQSGGRVAILVPPGLGYQWQSELREGGVLDVPNILRSLFSYLNAWSGNQQLWFEQPAVMVSHAFTNWRLSPQAAVWRWALVPELYARWREQSYGRFPRGYHGNEALGHGWVCGDVAKSVFAALPKNRKHPIRRLLEQFEEVQWPRPLEAAEYSKWGALRHWLERSVGIGLGVFDLIITDEAHRSRGTESGLSRLLENVIVPSDTARRLALTATPVELDVGQWHSTLSRLGLDATALAVVQEVTGQYADAVKRLRQAWRSCPEARAAYKIAAARFQEVLSPYLLRRDKREDPEVWRFHRHSGLPINAYRKETEISVKTEELSLAWRKAICAAESLSVVTRGVGDPVAKRLRLTLGNGHGIAALLDQIKRTDDDQGREQFDGASPQTELREDTGKAADLKRQERAEWWLNVIGRAFATGGDESLFDHPAITKAVETIEIEAQSGEKVLVFGRFTRPLRAVVDLLNAREMLRRVRNEEPWPQSKVHGDRDGDIETSEWLTYSGLSMSSGEQRVFRILEAVLRAPNHGLILVDEIDLFLHQDALQRLLNKLHEHCKAKNKQLVFTTHFPPVAEMYKEISIYTLNRIPAKTVVWQGYSYEAMCHITGTQERPISVYVEDDVAEQIISHVATQLGIRKFVQFGHYGPAGNAFSVSAGLYLSQHETDHTIAVLDGDVYGTRAERRDRVKATITGNVPEHEKQREELMRLIRTLTIIKDAQGNRLSPEQVLHQMLHSINPADVPPERKDLHTIACGVINVSEKHEFVNKIIEQTGESRAIALSKIVELASRSSLWARYTRPVRWWLQGQKKALHL